LAPLLESDGAEQIPERELTEQMRGIMELEHISVYGLADKTPTAPE